MKQTLTLPFGTNVERVRASQVIAQLVRECVGFKATQFLDEQEDDIVVITFTGGF